MALTTGTKLGPYEIAGSIGSGGMGEVYRARDSNLNRDVAVKVLPSALARDVERMARFQREAQVLASLNHPNIASIYGLEESGGVGALVMELVDGPPLADRIEKGPIPLEESLAIAKQMAEALEYAHEKGIMHRDLKPANVNVTAEGMVKVLDFGLAKAAEQTATSTNPASSPTLMAAEVKNGASFGTGVPHPLFEFRSGGSLSSPYAVTPDGQRFLLNSVVDESGGAPLTVVVNWTKGIGSLGH